MKTGRFARDGNASASASDTMIGNPKVQTTASGSRMNSRIRASVSWTSGRLLIAKMPSGFHHEHIFEGAVVGDDSGLAELRDQLLRRTVRDDAAMVNDGHAVAE